MSNIIQDGDRSRLLIDSLVDYGIFMLDVAGNVATWNTGAERLKGYTASEILGRHFSTFYLPEEARAGRCEHALASAEHEGRFEGEGWRLRKDGSRFWANVVITPIRDSAGQLIGFGKATRDLTERKAAEERLAKSEERLRLLIASVNDYAIFVLDPNGYVESWNTGAERLKGYRADEIVGEHFSVFYPDPNTRVAKCDAELVTALAVGRFEEEGWRVRKDGSLFWANVVLTPIREASGRLVGFAKVTRDLSERRRHDEERILLAKAEEAKRLAEENIERMKVLAERLEAARDSAERATRAKDEFLATVSHELRAPLHAMLGWAQMLQGTLPPEKATHAVNVIVRNALAQGQIIDDLLDVSRIVAGQLRLEVVELDFNQIVRAAAEVTRPAADAKEIRVQMAFDPELGGIQGDPHRLQQVMWNLLSNAIKFTPRGGRVDVTMLRSELALRVEISDSGRGISKEFLPHVFDRFSQQESGSTRVTSGLGLGLAIVRHLVELHGGTVEAFSEGEDQGATFVLVLPVSPERSSGTHPVPSDIGARTLREPPGLRHSRVLVIDDEKDARELIQSMLETAGASVQTVASVHEAFEEIAREKPDVIVSDIGMPMQDGYDFIRRLRSLPREQGGDIPALALTAFSTAADRHKALTKGFQDHACKPITSQELLVVVAKLLVPEERAAS